MSFLFNDTATTEIYTLSLHDALPISPQHLLQRAERERERGAELVRHVREEGRLGAVDLGQRLGAPPLLLVGAGVGDRSRDRKSTRLNSSHANISYAVFCLKKKNIPLP